MAGPILSWRGHEWLISVMPRLHRARRAREQKAVTEKVRHGGFAKATSNHRGTR